MVEAKWSGKYPNLCYGVWSIFVDDIDYSDYIPKEIRHSPMRTYGFYSEWSFDDDYGEVWEKYEDGLHFDEWVKQNDWVKNIPANLFDIYCAFSLEDWRHNSCGGCI